MRDPGIFPPRYYTRTFPRCATTSTPSRGIFLPHKIFLSAVCTIIQAFASVNVIIDRECTDNALLRVTGEIVYFSEKSMLVNIM